MGLGLEIEVRDELAPGGDSSGLVRELSAGGAKRVMLVGHEPDVSVLTTYLFPDWSRGFDKAMVVALRLIATRAREGSRCRARQMPLRDRAKTSRRLNNPKPARQAAERV